MNASRRDQHKHEDHDDAGALTPVPGITFTAKGLVFVAGADEGNGENGDSIE